MTPRALVPFVRALARRRLVVDDWGARATTGTLAWRAREGDVARAGLQELGHLRAIVHRDVPAGRGSASLDVDVGPTTPLGDLLADALDRALATIGPAWASPPPAAPARVPVADPRIVLPRDAAGELERTIDATAAAAGATVRALEIEVARRTVSVATSRGLEASWPETEARVRVELARGGRATVLERRGRRLADLELDRAIAGALADTDRAAAAEPTPSGRLPAAIEAGALLHGGLGLFAALLGQVDPDRERQGLGTARLGRPVLDGAATAAEPLTVISDGTLPFGLASTPVADTGEPVRRFALVEHGLVRGLPLDAREAALRGLQPNGGVRGLVVPAGGTDADALVDGPAPVLLIESLHWLSIEPVTGVLRARLALGRLFAGGGARAVRGGLLRADALAALALGRRSREVVSTPLYRGPRRWALGELLVEPDPARR